MDWPRRSGRLGLPSVVLAVASTASLASADAREPPADPYVTTLLAIARSIEGLKPEYPQLAEFSASANVDVDALEITYAHRTQSPSRTGGWTSGVPSPTEGGVWLHLDFHAPDSKAEIHTQPVVPRYRFRDKRVMLLLREGAKTKPLEGALVRILLDREVRIDEEVQPAQILGTWRGTSTCTDRVAAPACRDETVVYEFSAGSRPGSVLWKADKVVNGERLPMGEMDLTYDEGEACWKSEFASPRVHSVWCLAVSGDIISGRGRLLPGRQTIRKIEVRKDR